MKTTSRRIFGALLGLCVLSVIVPGVRADETADWMAEMRRQNDEFNRQAQEDRDARDKFNREAQEAREAMDKWNREVQEGRDNERKQQEWDDWLNRLRGDAPAAGAPAGPKSSPAKAPVARPAPVPQVRSFVPAAPQRRPVPQNPVAFQQMVRQNQARVRQQIMQTRQQIMRTRQQIVQIHQQMMQGR
jgi:hypothetical protein